MFRWRKATWALGLWTVLMGGLLVATVQSVNDMNERCVYSTISQSQCQTGVAVGGSVGVTVGLVIWFIGFIVLSLVWLMSRPQRRLCPTCGQDVKRGVTVCGACGFDFASAAQPR